MAYGNPTQAQVDAVTAAPDAKQGDVRVNRDQDGYIFAAGILKPEHSDYLSYSFPQYYATAMLERIGSYEATGMDVFSWSEQYRTRLSAEITAGGAAAGATITLTLDTAANATSDGYYIVGDTIKFENDIVGVVTAVGQAGGFQTITVAKHDNTPFVAADTADGERIGHLANTLSLIHI